MSLKIAAALAVILVEGHFGAVGALLAAQAGDPSGTVTAVTCGVGVPYTGGKC